MDLAKTLDAFTSCEAKVNQLSFDCSKMKVSAFPCFKCTLYNFFKYKILITNTDN